MWKSWTGGTSVFTLHSQQLCSIRDISSYTFAELPQQMACWWTKTVISTAVEWLQISKKSFYLKNHWQQCRQNIAKAALWILGFLKKKWPRVWGGGETFKISKTGYNFEDNTDNYTFIFLLRKIVKHNQNLTPKTWNVCFNFLYHARLQPSPEVLMKSFFWPVQHILTVAYRPIGSVFKGQADRETCPLNTWLIGCSETSVSLAA